MFKVIIINLITILFVIIICGLAAGDVIDIPSLISVFIPALAAPLTLFTVSQYKTAFGIAFRSLEIEPQEKEKLNGFFSMMGNTAVGFGWIAFLIAQIALLKNLPINDFIKSQQFDVFTVGFAASVITVLYGYIFKYGFCDLAEKRLTSK